MALMTNLRVVGSRRSARRAPASASGLLTGNDGRVCISSIGALPCASRIRSAQVAPIALSTRRRSAGVNASRMVLECAPLRCWFCAPDELAKVSVRATTPTKARRRLERKRPGLLFSLGAARLLQARTLALQSATELLIPVSVIFLTCSAIQVFAFPCTIGRLQSRLRFSSTRSNKDLLLAPKLLRNRGRAPTRERHA